MTDTYREWVEDRAAELGSDGCTGVSAAYRFCCLDHDVAYRLGKKREGTPISKVEADERFRSCIQRSSPFGYWSPMAWWRWLGVTWFGKRSAPAAFLIPLDPAAAARARIIREVEGDA